MQFSYSGKDNISLEEIQEIKQDWIDKLGPFTDEFDTHNGFIHVNLDKQKDDPNYYSFSLPDEYSLSDFIIRFNEYVKTLR